MRKLSAILLTGIFAFAQYARHYSYLECRILNTFRSSSQQCDCEKLLITERSDDPSPSVPANHLHIHPEELFDKPAEFASHPVFADRRSIHYYSDEHEPPGCNTSPWQPPDR